MPDKPLETDHPETTHLTAPCSCEACAAFTCVAARTLARSPICDLLHRRLQPFCLLHDCSGCFRLERLPGGTLTHWKAPPSHGAHVKRTLPIARLYRSRRTPTVEFHIHPTIGRERRALSNEAEAGMDANMSTMPSQHVDKNFGPTQPELSRSTVRLGPLVE